MHKIRFAHDENLEFPEQAKKWQDLFHRFDVEVVSYEDMAQLTGDLAKHQFTCAYFPAANQYYLRKDPFYRGVATGLTANLQSTTVKNVLVVKRNGPIERWDQLKGKRYGYINCYCTSSYFGMAIFLYKRGASFPDFFSKAMPAGAWQKQIDSVVEGKIDATMVMEEVWLMEPKNRETTRIIDSIEGLPGPSVIVSKEADAEWSSEFTRELVKPTRPNKEVLFSGFVPYQPALLEEFFADAEKALS